ncbi:MAG TPA: hypothetical protein VIV14_00725 [Gammaproteobacteria bacterium]
MSRNTAKEKTTTHTISAFPDIFDTTICGAIYQEYGGAHNDCSNAGGEDQGRVRRIVELS